jgi:hypothetical protein
MLECSMPECFIQAVLLLSILKFPKSTVSNDDIQKKGSKDRKISQKRRVDKLPTLRFNHFSVTCDLNL